MRVLGVERIVVMGHALCGGIHALLDGAPPEAQDFVAGWMGIAQRARAVALRCDTPEEQQEAGEHEAVRISLANLHDLPLGGGGGRGGAADRCTARISAWRRAGSCIVPAEGAAAAA